jgi:SAM-dependent methyltransferase
MMATQYPVAPALIVDPEALRSEVRDKYRAVAENPDGEFHFHTGRELALRLGYSIDLIDSVPEQSLESFAGIANPFTAGPVAPGSRIVDIGSGAGFDSMIAARLVGRSGRVIGVDMTPQMLAKARSAAESAQAENVEFREGIAEALPVDDGWADTVISNGVINLVVDKAQAFSEINRVLRPGGVLQFADIATGKPVSGGAKANIDLWAA